MQSAGAAGPGGEEMDVGVRSLIDVNGLAYRMTPGMSVATSRVTRTWDALRSSYAEGDVMSFAISSGAAFVDPDNSYISFQLQITTDAVGAQGSYRYFWGNDTKGRQGCLNLFQDMRLTHSSGYEIDRVVKGFAPWRYIQNAYTKDVEWFDTVGSLLRGRQYAPKQGSNFYGNDGSGGAWPDVLPVQAPQGILAPADQLTTVQQFGYNSSSSPPSVLAGLNQSNGARPFGLGDDAATAAGTIIVHCVVPLSCISGIWDTDQLSPSFLMAGARLELTIQNHAQVFVVRSSDAAGSVPDPSLWTISVVNPKLYLETITFTDAVLRAISMVSANSGLEIPFIAMHYSSVVPSASGTSAQINRGLSRANMVVVRNYPQTAVANTSRTSTIDSVAAYWLEPNTQGWQAKLGSEFMPTEAILRPMPLYHAVQNAFGNWKADRRNTVTSADYSGRGSLNSANTAGAFALFCPFATLGVYAMTLEKSSTLAQSGSPISASRDLNVVYGGSDFSAYSDPLWGGILSDIYVPYVTLATVFLDSVLTRS